MGRLAPHREPEEIVSFYRCGVCSYSPRNWPFMDDYKRCPLCDTPMAVHQGPVHEVMNEAEAHSLASQLGFEQWLENETDDERAARQEAYDAAAIKAERKRQRAATKIKKQFDEMIEGIEFEAWEYQMIGEMESLLPD